MVAGDVRVFQAPGRDDCDEDMGSNREVVRNVSEKTGSGECPPITNYRCVGYARLRTGARSLAFKADRAGAGLFIGTAVRHRNKRFAIGRNTAVGSTVSCPLNPKMAALRISASECGRAQFDIAFNQDFQ
jgi:hypothetical protein